MDAVEFLKEKNRMCREYGGLPEDCFICPIGNGRGECQAGILENQKVTEEILVQIVEKWAKEHPKKTRQSEFLEQYPEALVDAQGIININPCMIERQRFNQTKDCSNSNISCRECREKFWGEELKNE